jgi:hypothetical protein
LIRAGIAKLTQHLLLTAKVMFDGNPLRQAFIEQEEGSREFRKALWRIDQI